MLRRMVVGGRSPRGYRIVDDSLKLPLEPDAPYRAGFGRGEAFSEVITFVPSELTDDVLTFKHETMSIGEFMDQTCDRPAS